MTTNVGTLERKSQKEREGSNTVQQDDEKARKIRRRRRKNRAQQAFSAYLSFGLHSTAIMGCFFVCYILVLACLFPMLTSTYSPLDPSQAEGMDDEVHGKSLFRGPLQGAHFPKAPSKDQLLHTASKLRSQFQKLRKSVSDEILVDEARAQFDLLKAGKEAARQKAVGNNHVVSAKGQSHGNQQHDQDSDGPSTPGFMVLGMHRSGTSMLSGLLVQGSGYHVGGPLIGAAFDNEKGFFERIDIVLQNDEFMQAQKIWWNAGVINYDADLAYTDYKTKSITFEQGKPGLAFLNDPTNAPWLQKDPRMCICLKTWLKIMDHKPAVVFTYRHPLEVAKSLKKRENDFTMERGLRLWIVYNMRAVENSAGLCRVLSSNDAVLQDPLQEVSRIAKELTSKCGVPAAPKQITKADVAKFVDPKLQHNKKQLHKEEADKAIMKDYDGCVIREYTPDEDTIGKRDKERELFLYEAAMTIYCDFQSGKAYKPDYEWPDLLAGQ